MKKKRVSIKDIAKHLNVSVTTVSFVLNGKAKEKRISEEVTNKILDYVKKINYKPNQLAQSLRTGQSKILVLMVEDISNYFFSKLARVFEDLAYEKGYKVLFCSNENSDKKSIELIDLFNERQVDGFIIIPSAGIENKIKSLQQQNIPVVLLDRFFEGMEIGYVGIDNRYASRQGIDHLNMNGFNSPAFVSIDVQQTQMLGRLEGYQEAAKEYSFKEKKLLLPYNLKSNEQGREILKKFFNENPELDSILFATNYLTQLGLEVLKNDFPEKIHQLGIITFDDNALFSICTPAITAICQPIENMAKETMNILFQLINKPTQSTGFQNKILKTSLEVRESTKALIERV